MALGKLNEKQAQAVAMMNSRANVFLTGGAGTGKSHVLQHFVKLYKDKEKLAVTSTTGISAVSIGGDTLHSWSGIGLGKGNFVEMVQEWEKDKDEKEGDYGLYVWIKKRWNKVETLIIDEISMLSLSLFERLHDLACYLRNDQRTFGGIQLIVVGDFCQLPPVHGEGLFCFQSKVWELCRFKVSNLTEIVRQDDTVFAKLLKYARLGDCNFESQRLLNKRMGLWKPDMTIGGIKPTILYPKNRDVDVLNDQELQKLIDKGCEYKEYEVRVDVVKNDLLGTKALANLKNHLTKGIEKLHFCVGAQVMLTRNLEIESGLVNGSRGIVEGFDDNGNPVIKFLCGITKAIGRYKSVYYKKEKKRNKEREIELHVKQIPLKLAWAVTIHKSQGATLDYVVTDLTEVFADGQAYVALSRVRSLKDLYLTGIDFGLINCHPDVKKFYTELDG